MNQDSEQLLPLPSGCAAATQAVSQVPLQHTIHRLDLGALYQGRFKSFPIQKDGHFLTACRYVERNALSANLVDRAEEYRWGSLWVRRQGAEAVQGLLADWPIDRPSGWVRVVNRPMGEDDVEQMETSIQRGRPLGTPQWVRQSTNRLGMEHTLRSEGRPRKVMT